MRPASSSLNWTPPHRGSRCPGAWSQLPSRNGSFGGYPLQRDAGLPAQSRSCPGTRGRWISQIGVPATARDTQLCRGTESRATALEAAARSAAGDLRESSADQRGARQAAPAQTRRVAGAHFRALSGKWRDAPSSPAPAAQHSQADADPCLGVRPEPDHAPVVRLRHTPWSRERALAPTRLRSPSPPAHLPSPAEDDSNPHIDPFGSAVSHRHRPRWPVFRHGLLVLVDFFPQSGIPSKEGDVAGGHRSEAGRPQGSAGGKQVPGVDGVVERPAARVEGTRDE